MVQVFTTVSGGTYFFRHRHTGKIYKILESDHEVFSLEPLEWSETNFVEIEISTGNAEPVGRGIRRMPFVVCSEAAKQLEVMQSSIQPSNSPWASPVVMVKKLDGTHRFCVD